MKAIAVIDITPTCEECPCCIWDNFYTPPRCVLEQKGWINEDTFEKPIWCPLKPLPQKSTYELADDHPFTKAEIMAYAYGITVGRNQVIEEITDESNISD